MDDEPVVNINVLVDSKKEYVDQLARGLLRPIFESLRMIVQDALNVSQKNGMEPRKALRVLLSEVPKWDQKIVEEETNGIIQTVPYLKDLLKAYFVCASMIMGSIRMSKEKNQKMKIRVPSPERFVHMVLKNAAFDIIDDLDHFLTGADEQEDGAGVGVFNHRTRQSSWVAGSDFKLNRRHVVKTIEDAIKDALHSLMPIDDLLKEYMGDILSRDTFKGGEEGEIDVGGAEEGTGDIGVEKATERDMEGSIKGVHVRPKNMRQTHAVREEFESYNAPSEMDEDEDDGEF